MVKSNFFRGFSFTSLFFFLLSSVLFLSSCATKKSKGSGDEATQSYSGEDKESYENLSVNADSDSGNAGPISTLYFAFDSSALSSSAKDQLMKTAEFLKKHPSVEVQIEGHTDERGGVQYNVALGYRRAKSVKRYLVALGVKNSQVGTISYGKERPVAFGHGEDAWSQNRRANFVVTAK